MASPTEKKKILADLRLILASASPRRAVLLKKAGVKFKVIVPRIGEKKAEDIPHLTPAEIALNNAYLKARSVSALHPDEWVLGADTVVVIDGQLIGKPKDMKEAREFFDLLNARTHQVITAAFLIREDPFHQSPFYDVSRVTFNRLTPEQRDRYLETIDPFDKAGAYAVQSGSDRVIKKVEGSFSNVMGLPVEKLLEVLQRLARHSKKQVERLRSRETESLERRV